MLSLRRLLVATDFSEHARYARRRAQHLARAVGAELHTLHVRTGRDNTSLDALADLAAFETFTRDGVQPPAIRAAHSPAAGILTYAEEHDIDFIAMGTHGRTGLKRWVLGSVAEEVVRRAPCPVLTIREGLEPAADAPPAAPAVEPPRRIVVAVDFTEGTRALVAHAREVAALAGARVDVVHVLEEPAAFRLFDLDGFRSALPRLAVRARARLQETVDAVPGPRVPLRTFVLTGDPAAAVARYAEAQQADLVFVGTHGDAGPRAVALGSVTERVMRMAPCPVLTLNATAASLVRAPGLTDARPLTPPPAIA